MKIESTQLLNAQTFNNCYDELSTQFKLQITIDFVFNDELDIHLERFDWTRMSNFQRSDHEFEFSYMCFVDENFAFEIKHVIELSLCFEVLSKFSW